MTRPATPTSANKGTNIIPDTQGNVGKKWCRALGENYTVEVANEKKSSTKGLATVVVTKKKTTDSERNGTVSGNPSSVGLTSVGSAHLSPSVIPATKDTQRYRNHQTTCE